MNNKAAVLIQILALTYFLYSCHPDNKTNNSTTASAKTVSFIEGFIVRPTVLDQTISISGTLKPFEETTLMPEVAGRVVVINLQEGKFVKQGILLVKLFDDDLQAQLHKSQTQLDIAEQTQKRQSELIKINGISQLDYDQAVLLVHSIKADIEVINAQIRKTEVLAPFDGVIGLRNISIGAEVTPGIALATIRQINQLKLDFSVPEKYSKEVKPGTKIKFNVQGDDIKYDAVVIATEEGIDENTRNLKARALVNSNASSLVPGSFANVELRLKEIKNALMVPTQAIIPQEINKQLIVAFHGNAKFLTVKTGVRQDSIVEVLNGLKPGDTVVTTGIPFIRPKMFLKFAKVR